MMKKLLTLMALTLFITNAVSAGVTEISMEERTQKTLQLSSRLPSSQPCVYFNIVYMPEGLLPQLYTSSSSG